MLKKFRSRISRANDWHHTFQKEITLISNVKMKNKQLYQELELACQQQDGYLTYAEYLTIDQFGKHGYYSTSKKHGKTDVDKRWGAALANYCQQEKFDTIIEFGCGTGELGIATAKAYSKRTKRHLNWIGIEVDRSIHERIYNSFLSHNMQDAVEQIAESLDVVQPKQHPLLVFPYSLDNIPPQVFINTHATDSPPTALLGITASKGMISEVILPSEALQKKKMQLNNGIFTHKKVSYNLSSWRLRKGQRAYIATDAFRTIATYAKKFPDATMIIIDEFRNEPWFFSLDNRGTPKSLYESNLICYEKARYYRESGKHNLYYPLYRDGFFSFLNAIGFRSAAYDIEQKKASQLRGKPWFPIGKNYTTLAFIAKEFVEKKNISLPIPFTPQRIL